jgi:CxxC-x17-CxxC domain-containing protein
MAYGSGGYSRGGGSGFRRGGSFNRFNNGPREMHKIKCSECGKEDEVPFKPRNDAPVYCKDCYFKKKGITPREQAVPKEQTELAESEEAEESTEEEY